MADWSSAMMLVTGDGYSYVSARKVRSHYRFRMALYYPMYLVCVVDMAISPYLLDDQETRRTYKLEYIVRCRVYTVSDDRATKVGIRIPN